MRGSVSSELVAELARIAGFTFASDRCERLASQLEWLLAKVSRVEELSLSSEEPVGFFRPGEAVVAFYAEKGDFYE